MTGDLLAEYKSVAETSKIAKYGGQIAYCYDKFCTVLSEIFRLGVPCKSGRNGRVYKHSMDFILKEAKERMCKGFGGFGKCYGECRGKCNKKMCIVFVKEKLYEFKELRHSVIHWDKISKEFNPDVVRDLIRFCWESIIKMKKNNNINEEENEDKNKMPYGFVKSWLDNDFDNVD